ncbi:hypothetical protein cce_2780 [Crocosphaera subtropica ATCC 51142]|uniref:Uncharacterized protein n=1 Tax=Crocosphaera subtropica (strain ATCC 51142 / BH68) TaxID=43989 RepID=B1WU66_CROS5|nr:hypothetical protein [Crocosphaera subtropica]ACB52128.1 hypothetical protein cce_2780 [Crocosphaera subtropica ATCC 51142]
MRNIYSQKTKSNSQTLVEYWLNLNKSNQESEMKKSSFDNPASKNDLPKEINSDQEKAYNEALLARTDLYQAKNKAIVKLEQLARRLIFEVGIIVFFLLICAFGMWTTITLYSTETSLQNHSSGLTGGGITSSQNGLEKTAQDNLRVRESAHELVTNRWVIGSLGGIVIVSIFMMSDIIKKSQLRTKIDTANEILSELDKEIFGI